MTRPACPWIHQYSPVGGLEETTGGVGEVKPSARVWAPPAAASGAVEEGTVAGTRGVGADAEVAGRGGVPAEPAGAERKEEWEAALMKQSHYAASEMTLEYLMLDI